MLTVVYANDTNSLAIRIRAIREIRSSYHKVQSSNLKVQRILWIRGIRVIRSPNLFYISGQEKVRNGVENQLFCYLCKYFVINQLSNRGLKAAY